jgi:glutathione S-transferase
VKLITSIGPNPAVVDMFMAERGIKELARETVDIRAGANRQAAYLEKNPAGGSPCLELDDGSYLAEITAICEYLDEKFPGPSLIGDTPEERAETRMWTRRIDLGICEPMANGFRFSEGLPMFKDRMPTLPHAADGLKGMARDKLLWLDGLVEGRTWICGERFTLADVLLFCFLAFGDQVGQPLPEGCKNLQAWRERVAGRAAA